MAPVYMHPQVEDSEAECEEDENDHEAGAGNAGTSRGVHRAAPATTPGIRTITVFGYDKVMSLTFPYHARFGSEVKMQIIKDSALFVFSIGGPKQNVKSFLTPFSESVFMLFHVAALVLLCMVAFSTIF